MVRQSAAPLLRFRTRDHVQVKTSPCPCGRTGPRIRCIGRTDDMLIVRGVNVFPSALEGIVRRFPAVEEFLIEVYRRGQLDEVRLLLEVQGSAAPVVAAVREAVRVDLGIRVEAVPVPGRSLPRYELKARRLVRRAGDPQ